MLPADDAHALPVPVKLQGGQALHPLAIPVAHGLRLVAAAGLGERSLAELLEAAGGMVVGDAQLFGQDLCVAAAASS